MLGLVLLTKPARVSPVSTWEVVVVVEDKANQRLDVFARGARVSAPLPIWIAGQAVGTVFTMQVS